MGKRLSRIATKTGDDGATGLADGSRDAKDSLRITALSEVDELNSHLGVIVAFQIPDDVRKILNRAQHQLFDIGAKLCVPGSNKVGEDYVSELDAALEHFNAPLPAFANSFSPAVVPLPLTSRERMPPRRACANRACRRRRSFQTSSPIR